MKLRSIIIFVGVSYFFHEILKEFDKLHVFQSKHAKSTQSSCMNTKFLRILRQRLIFMSHTLSGTNTQSFSWSCMCPHAFRDLEVILHVILMCNWDAANIAHLSPFAELNVVHSWALIGNVGNMSVHVTIMPTLLLKNWLVSNVSNAVTGFRAGSLAYVSAHDCPATSRTHGAITLMEIMVIFLRYSGCCTIFY